MSEITLTGSHEGVQVSFDNSIHVKLSDGFYRKDDPLVVKVGGRYYRKESPYIVEASNKYYLQGTFFRREDIVEDINGNILHYSDSITENFIFSRKEGSFEYDDLYIKEAHIHKSEFMSIKLILKGMGSPMYVGITNEIQNKRIFVPVLGKIYKKHIDDPSLNKLSPRFYRGGNLYFDDASDLVNVDGEYFLKKDCLFSKDLDGNDYKLISIGSGSSKITIDKRENPFTNVLSLRNLITCIFDGKKINCQPIRAWDQVTLWSPEFKNIDSDFNIESFQSKFGFSVCKGELESINRIYDDILSSKENASGVKSIKNVLDWFGNYDPKNNLDIYIKGLERDTGGDYVHYRPREKTFEKSDDLSMTGGIGYTFGVELETSFGIVPKLSLYEKQLEAVGDRSIGSLEYVTKPLHGNNGMNYIYDICTLISRYCAIDDRCGIHVHIGGKEGCETPSFTREFSILSIMLGTMIEKEMFSLLPSNRMDRMSASGVPYCGSILNFSSTNLNNGEKMLSHYVFGNDRGFNDDQNENTELHRWVSTRYKWLNLVNCNTRNSGRRGSGGFRTIEFRQYNASLNPTDLFVFILMSMSFVKFVENNKSDIVKGGVTLDYMLKNTLNEESYLLTKKWINERSALVKKVKSSKTRANKLSL